MDASLPNDKGLTYSTGSLLLKTAKRRQSMVVRAFERSMGVSSQLSSTQALSAAGFGCSCPSWSTLREGFQTNKHKQLSHCSIKSSCRFIGVGISTL